MRKVTSFLILCVSGISLTLAAASPAASPIRVESSRSLKLAVVNLDRHNPASEQLQQTFAESFGFEVSQRCKSPVPVKPTVRGAQEAAFGLSTGSLDFAVVFGSNVPPALVGSDYLILKAVPASGNARNDDPGLVRIIEQSFPEALKGEFFQKALLKYSGENAPGSSGDWKIATN
jgi:hypothetical protein